MLCFFATSTVVYASVFITICFTCLLDHTTGSSGVVACVRHIAARGNRRHNGLSLPAVGRRINANPPKGQSQIHLQRDVASQQR